MHILTERQLCDLELIMNGAFYPLKGFLNFEDYKNVLSHMRLADGTLWPMPIVLDSNVKYNIGDEITLSDTNLTPLALLKVESVFTPNREKENEIYSHNLFPTLNYYIGGTVTKINDIKHITFNNYRHSPEYIKEKFKDKNLIGFQTRNPMHKSHFQLTQQALDEVPNSVLLLHPCVGSTAPGDVDYITRTKCYISILKYYEPDRIFLSLLPLAMRMGGPREALWHAIIRKNYGCTHFIIGRDHAGINNIYSPYAAQELVKQYEKEIGINILTYPEIPNISGTELRRKMREGEEIPDWYTFPEVGEILSKKRGMTILITGLSSSGKTTLANSLILKLREKFDKEVTLLDGDVIREHFTKGLGFSKEDRIENMKRLSYVSSLINKNGGVTIISAICPYEESREYCRKLNCEGKYIEIYLSTSLQCCEKRDVKNLYVAAREGKIKNFTGISDPYEIPTSPDTIIDTEVTNIYSSIEIIENYL